MSSAVPADLRAYSRAAVQIDDQIHELALRLGRVLDAYRATRPEFGTPIPRIEDDLVRYAQRCREIDRRVGRIADAFERAGATQHADVAPGPGQPLVVAEAVLARAVQAATAPPEPKPSPKSKEHHDDGLLGGLLHAVEHPVDTLGSAASAAEHVASDALGSVGHTASAGLDTLEDAGAALVHGIEHPSDALSQAASGLETAAGDVRGFVDSEHLGPRVLQGLEALGGTLVHDIEHPLDVLASAEQAAKDFVAGFASGVKDMAQAAMLLARVIPGTPMWAASMAVDPVGTMNLQEQFARGLVHMASNPGEALGTMIEIKDLEAGDFARWEGHLTPDVIVTLLTMGAGGAAAGAGEGIAATAAEATSEQAAKTVVEDAATTAAQEAAQDTGARAAEDATASAASDAEAGARGTAEWTGAEGEPPTGEGGGASTGTRSERWPVDDSGYRLQQRDLDFLRLTCEQIDWVLDRRAPLGMTPAQFSEFRSSLLEALRREGIDPAETDIRLHGSGANVFSGSHKTLPTEAELADNPEALARLREWLGDDSNRPLRRPFDSMHRLGLDDPSDYDLNISNARMVEIARSRWDPARFPKDFMQGHGYLNKGLMNDVFPELRAWAQHWSRTLGRDVSQAVFEGTGPLNTSGMGSGISVHFRETDWIVHSPVRP